MKVILPALVLFLLASFLGQCSSRDVQSPPQSTNSNYSSPSSNQSSNEDNFKIPYDEIVGAIAKFSKQSGMDNLKDAKLSDSETEIRIWKGWGLAFPRCFVLKFRSGNADAFLVAPKKIVDGKGVYAKALLNSPRSGWNNLSISLKEQGIGSSVELAQDKNDIVDPDIELIIIEMKKESRHTMAYYTQSTETTDGKKAFAICRTIENEFEAHIGC